MTAALDRVFPPGECDDTDPAVARFMSGPVAPPQRARLDMDADADVGVVRDREASPWLTHRGRT